MTRVESIVTSSRPAIIEIFLDLLVRVETLYFPEYRVCGAYVHKAHIIFHLIDPRKNLYIDLKISSMKISIIYIEYIQMYLYQSVDTIYCDIQYMMTTILMFLLEQHEWT
jgi:cystathionine beta-lyase/cystathionine gamma-synthase